MRAVEALPAQRAALMLPAWRGACARLLALALLAPGISGAQSPASSAPAASVNPLPPVETFFRQADVGEVVLSPSGKRLAMTVPQGGKHRVLIVLELGEQPKGAPVAAYSDADVVDVQWVSEERLIYSLQKYPAAIGGRDSGGEGLYAVDFDGKQPRQLIQSRAYADSLLLANNHSLLFVPPLQAHIEPGVVVISSGGRREDGVYVRKPLWLDTRSGRSWSLAVPQAPKDVTRWLLDQRAEPRVAITTREGRDTVHWRAPGQSAWVVLAELDALLPAWQPHAVGDDGSLYVTHAAGPAGETVLARYDFAAKRPGAAIVQTPGFDFSGSLIPGEPGRPALGVRFEAELAGQAWFDAGMRAAQTLIDERLPGRINELSCRRCGQADMVALVFSHSDRDPGRWLLYEAGSGRLKNLAAAAQGLEPRRMARVELRRISARDGRDLPVWLTLPVDVPEGRPAPAVVLVHDEPWWRGGHWDWEPMAQFLASRGYLVVAPEFRGSAGYGQKHFEAGWKQWGLAMQDDVADALLWARKQGLATDRACIAGTSYGGYSALMGLARHPQLYRCGVVWNGLIDPAAIVEGVSYGYGGRTTSSGQRRYLMEKLIGDTDADAQSLKARSALNQTARIRAPLLLAHGSWNPVVPIEDAERLRDRLTQQGAAPEWVAYPRDGHQWLEPGSRLDWARRVEAFLQRHLVAAP